MRCSFKIVLFFLCLVPFWALATEQIIRYDITGLKGDALKNVQTALQGAKNEAFERKKVLDKNDIERLFDQSDRLVHTALQPYGYFLPTIHSSVKLTEGAYWTFHFDINPGPRLEIGSLNLQITGPGADTEAFDTWKRKFPLQVGQAFESSKYTNAKQSFFDVANKFGYIRAKLLEGKTTINMQQYSANVNLQYDTGDQYFYGPISFAKTDLKHSLLERYIQMNPNEPYSIPKLLRAQQNLSNSGYYSSVSIYPVTKKEKDKSIPLYVSLKQVKKMLYTIGVGYGTDTGARGQLGWDWRLINSSGHHMSTQYNVSQIGNSFGTTYYIPGHNPLTQQYSISANTAFYDTNAGTSSVQNYAALYNLNLKRWQLNYGINFQSERYRLVGQNELSAQLLMPTLTWTWLDTNDPLRPRYGTRITLNLRGTVEDTISSVLFAQYQLSFRTLQPINHWNRLFFRGIIGSTFTDHFDKLPLSLRFTTGGAQSVRGYGYQTLGPGKNILVGSAAYQYRLVGNWFASYFQDIGNAFDKFDHPNLQRSQGIGVVWQSPIGIMELDYSQSLTEPRKDPAVQFSMGGLL